MAFKSVLRLLLLCFSVLGVAWGQQPLNPADSQFTQDFGTDSINLQSLAITVKAPVLAKPGAIPFRYALVGSNSCQAATLNGSATVVCGYLNQSNASLLCETAQCLSLWPATTAGLWSLESGNSLIGQPCGDGGVYTKYTAFTLVAPDGSTYSLPSSAYAQFEDPGHGTGACNHSFTAYTTDGGISVTSDSLGNLVSLTFPNGQVYNGALTDAFGNAITPVAGGYSDTLGVNPALSIAAQSGGTGEIDTYKDTGGVSHQIKQVLTAKTVKTTFGCVGWPDQTLTGKYAVTEIDYPDGNNIGLSYETVTGGITGRISSLTLRTGGTVNYSYGMVYCNAGTLIPQSLSRTDADGTTTYSVTIQTNGTTTTVVDPGKNKKVYTFQGTNIGSPIYNVPLTLTQVQVYRNTGTVATPVDTLLSRTLYCYNNVQTNCDTTQATYPITQKDTYVLYGTMVVNSRVKETFDSFGNLLTTSRYDFGAGSPTIVTTIQYGSWNGTSVVAIGNGIINKPGRVTTVGAGSTIADTTYSYLSNGFLSGENHWSGTSWITTMTASANGNGTVHQRFNAFGTPTTFTYAGTGAGGCNAILPTATATTIGSAVLNTSATWDCNGGKLLTSTDENTNQSHFTYDLMFRPFSQTDPLTYQVNELYSQTTAQVSDPYITTTTTVGGFGRVNRVQTTDGASYDTASTSYAFNANSNTQFQISTSQPCIAAVNADCTKNHFTTLDPMGRPISSSTTSNETVATVYYGDATHSVFDVQQTLTPVPTGENSKVTQTEYDGLGRVKSICAIQVTGGSSCGQAMGGSGIKTSFTYTYAAGQTTVAATRGSQTHTTVYDAAGRAKSVTIPEGGSTLATSGTTSYIYDQATASCGSAAAPGVLLEVVDNAGVHTCQGYDAAMRPTNTFVAGTSNPCRVLVYGDQSGLAVLNGDNRVVEAWTDADCSGASKITDEQFSYDKVGRIKDVWETTPHSGGQYHTTAAYYLNGKLNTLSGVPGKSTYTVSLNTNGRPNSATLGATAIINSVTRNGAGQVTNFAWGSGSSSDAYTFDANTGRMKTYTFTVGASTDKGTLTWNTNGTLKTLAIVDGLNAGGTQTCNFTYDDVVRILTDNCGAVWNQSYTYSDQYNNFSKSGSSNWNPGYSTTNNHITGATYDSDGQVTYDKNNSFAWDGYHRMITANAGAALGNCGSAGVTCVTYDAFGRPVERNVAGTFTEFLYSPLGLTATMSGQTTSNLRLPLPGGGSLNSTSANNAIYHPDWLGSARLVTNTGTTILLDTAYTPYGEKYATFGTNPQNFTGDYQDMYAGLFDTLFREFDVASGSRWLLPDPAHASWNAYSYPTNPNSFTDPLGLDSCGNKHDKGCNPRNQPSAGDTSGDGDFVLGGLSVTSPNGEFGLLTAFSGSSGATSSGSMFQMVKDDVGVHLLVTPMDTFSNGCCAPFQWGGGPVGGASSYWGTSSVLSEAIYRVSKKLGVPASIEESDHAAEMAQLVLGIGRPTPLNGDYPVWQFRNAPAGDMPQELQPIYGWGSSNSGHIGSFGDLRVPGSAVGSYDTFLPNGLNGTALPYPGAVVYPSDFYKFKP